VSWTAPKRKNNAPVLRISFWSHATPTENNWDHIQQLFLAAADLAAEQRASYLDGACNGDAALRAEVESLLSYDDSAPGPRIEISVEAAAQSLFAARGEELAGTLLGPWRVIREIDRGGMATVYLATRGDDEFEKRVAIKVVRPGMDTADLLERFRYERQILANLDHPYIARLLDGGSTAHGRPFLVMEYVEGQPIDAYCRQHELGIHDRCTLFLEVLEAVSYAHRNLVVHRDLKPGNIFVARDGLPKLLDFGVAKLLDTEGGEGSAATRLTGRPMTPEYASPEQVMGLPVGTASDVYSLGVVLYELLTGVRPQRVNSANPAEIERVICRTATIAPSEALADAGASGRRLPKQLKGDLDNIVLMAMRKEPARRYRSVDELAADLRAYLEGRPVRARKDSVRYRSAKFVGRHKLSVSMAVIAVASLLAVTFIALREARTAELARRNAEFERARAERRLGQMVTLANGALFDIHGAIERLPGSMEARKRLVDTTVNLLEEVARDAGGDDSLRLALATGYCRLGDLQGDMLRPSLGDAAGAIKSYRTAAALLEPVRRRHPGDPPVMLNHVRLQIRLGVLEYEQSDQKRARDTVAAVLPEARQLAALRPNDPDYASQPGAVFEAFVALGRHTGMNENLADASEYLKEFEKLAATFPGHEEIRLGVANAHAQVGVALHGLRKLNRALHEFADCVRVREQMVAAHPNDVIYRRELMIGYGHIAAAYGSPFLANLGRPDEARRYYRKCVDIAESIRQDDPRNRAALYDVAAALFRLGAVDTAPAGREASLETLRRAEKILESMLAVAPGTRRYLSQQSMVYEYEGTRLREMGRYDEAMAAFKRSLAMSEKILMRDKSTRSAIAQSIASERGMAMTLSGAGQHERAVALARKTVDRLERLLAASGQPDPSTYAAEPYLTLATVLARAGHCRGVHAAARKALAVTGRFLEEDAVSRRIHEQSKALIAGCGVAQKH
jgi:eukaryotic-like serine/threonine-protein kinase